MIWRVPAAARVVGRLLRRIQRVLRLVLFAVGFLIAMQVAYYGVLGAIAPEPKPEFYRVLFAGIGLSVALGGLVSRVDPALRSPAAKEKAVEAALWLLYAAVAMTIGTILCYGQQGVEELLSGFRERIAGVGKLLGGLAKVVVGGAIGATLLGGVYAFFQGLELILGAVFEEFE